MQLILILSLLGCVFLLFIEMVFVIVWLNLVHFLASFRVLALGQGLLCSLLVVFLAAAQLQ